MGISVVICCYNSSQRLPETLRHLANQQVQDIEWEIVLVDNASTDDTASVAEKIWQGNKNVAPLKIVSETTPGLSYARDAGIKNAAYDIIIFCDDDNWLSPQYVQTGHDIMSSDATIGICGAVGEAAFEQAQPDWFEKYKLVFACGEQAAYEGPLGIDVMAVYGAGMIVRRSIYDTLREQNYTFILTGRKGNKVIAGEDYELAILSRALGYKLYYSKSLTFKHYMPAGRMQWKYLVRTVHGSALGSAVLFIYADKLRYLLTGNSKYKVSWIKDIAKAVYGAFLIKIDRPRDLQIVWARLSGSVYSVFTNISNYPEYGQKIKRLYELKHKGV